MLVRRAQNPMSGVWTLPGGRVEFGERLEHAIRREVTEETGLTISLIGLAAYREILPGQSGNLLGHFVILPFAARWQSGEVKLNAELDDFRWIKPADLGEFHTTEGLATIVATAQKMQWQT